MRFPNEAIPPAVAPVDATEISPKAAVGPVRRIGDGTRDASAQFGERHEGEGERPPFLEREREERRLMCRRIYHIPVMLDTRTGEDRRKETRRPDDVVTHMDREV